MASRCINRSLFSSTFRCFLEQQRSISLPTSACNNLIRRRTLCTYNLPRSSLSKAKFAGIFASALASTVFAWKYFSGKNRLQAAADTSIKHEYVHRTKREKRFNDFASCEYNGELFMTPRDFLESMTMSDPRGRIGRRQLTNEEVELMIKSTPPLKSASKRLFRNIYESGIISFSEYLFLLSILTRSKRGIEIAFKMLDVDENKEMDKLEFLVLAEMVNMKTSSKSMTHMDETLKSNMDTTLLVHFFGEDGKKKMMFEQFHNFMENLQYEALELEFFEFSRGMPKITEEDFARILLRNTNLHPDDRHQFLVRVTENHQSRKGITLEQFIEFNKFLNNLDDFTIAIQMYTVAQQPVSEEEFQRAVKSVTGKSLDPHTLYTVFVLFDVDGDGMLSYTEFLDVMKDRVKRGFRAHGKDSSGWEGFKMCVKREMTS